jgi:uncharacterized protein
VVALDKGGHRSQIRPVKPADHPEFFRFPAPEGRSRESTIRLDAEGTFFHDDEKVEHPKLAAAMHGWISRHPDDGRYILTNGYDWTYFKVDDAPYVVRAIRFDADEPRGGPGAEPRGDVLRDDEPRADVGLVTLVLSDGTEEAWQPEASRIGVDSAVYTQIKRAAPGGPFEAKFSRHAQIALAPLLVEAVEEDGGPKKPALRLKNRTIRIGP